jgi:hypothetical protein
MAPCIRKGEVSEVRFQVLNRPRSDMWSIRNVEWNASSVCSSFRNWLVQREARQCSLTRKIHRKSYACKGLDSIRPQATLARLARLREVMVFGLTSPRKASQTLGFHTKARLARLFPPMLTHVHACVRTHRINFFTYRSGPKLTSPNLANLARQLAKGIVRAIHTFRIRTALPHVATSLPVRRTSRTSYSSRQWANSGTTASLPLWHSDAPSDGSSPKQSRRFGPREQPRYSTQFVCFVRPQLPSQRIAL